MTIAMIAIVGILQLKKNDQTVAPEPEKTSELTRKETISADAAGGEGEADRLMELSIRKTYALGDTFDADTLGLCAVYESGREVPISSGFTCSPKAFYQAGTQTVTVSYGGITETTEVEVLDFTAFELSVDKNSGEGYNPDRRVGWVLYVTVRYVGNYTEVSFENDLTITEPFSGSFSTEWENASGGSSSKWGYSSMDSGVGNYHGGGAFTLPDDPALAGNYTATVTFGDLKKQPPSRWFTTATTKREPAGLLQT